MKGDSEEITPVDNPPPPTSEAIRLSMLREYWMKGVTVDFPKSLIQNGFFGGSINSHIEKIELRACKREGAGYRCKFRSRAVTRYSPTGGTAFLTLMSRAMSGKSEEVVDREFEYDYALTSKGWRSSELDAELVRNNEQSRRQMQEGVKAGLKAGSCAVTMMGPAALVPMDCR